MADVPTKPRIQLAPPIEQRTLLDGGWWPRSRDPLTELPGLILAIDAVRGPIRQLALGLHGWDARPKRLFLGDRKIRLGFFESQTPALLTATAGNGERVDLLVIPPDTPVETAQAALHTAADPANRLHAERILEPTATTVRPDPGTTRARRDLGG
jgi:hypothetical protein